MELVLKDVQSTLKVSENIFNCDFNKSLVHQAVVAYAASARQGTRSQKTRAEVTGSSKKPWRQKGTGRARSGSIKSPIWRSGGVAFAARPQDHSQKINRKMYRRALKSILSELVRQNRLIIVENFSIAKPKTKFLVEKLKDMSLKNILIIIGVGEESKNLSLAASNLHEVDVCNTTGINPINLISFDKVMLTTTAVKQIEDMLL